MQHFILVRPSDDEPLITSHERADAGYDWLIEHQRRGDLGLVLPFRKTGGIAIAITGTDDPVAGVDEVRKMFADYPLLSTVTLMIEPLFDTLDEGWVVLHRAIDAHLRIAELEPAP